MNNETFPPAFQNNYDLLKEIASEFVLHEDDILTTVARYIQRVRLDEHEVRQSADLLVSVAAKEIERLDALHKQYDRLIWSVVWKTLKDDAGSLFNEHRDKRFVAEDIHSECWTKIIKQLHQFRDGNGSNLTGWLVTVSRNVVVDWKRKAARRNTIAPMTRFVEASNVTTSAAGQVESELSRPTPWYRGGLRTARLLRKNRSAVLCPECGVVIAVKAGAFSLECGHVRPKAIPAPK